MVATGVHIRIAERKQIWYAGDTIIGEVILSNPSHQVDVTAVSILLNGKSKTRITRSNGNHTTVYRAKVTIFKLVQVVFQGPFTLPPGNQSWPFEFVIPEDCRFSVGDKFDSIENFDCSNQQPLPPSFAADAYRKECSNEYALEAIVDINKTFAWNKETTLPLFILPKRIQEATDYQRVLMPNGFTFRSLHFDSEIKDRSLTFKEKMKSTFKPDTLPRCVINVKMEVPEAVVIGTAPKPVMYLELDLARSTATELPVVYLVSWQMVLKADIFIRTAGRWGGSQVHDFEDRYMVGSWAGHEPLSERFEIDKLFPRGLIVGASNTSQIVSRLVPTFRTFNIAVLYRWKINYTVECGGKTENSEVNRGCIVLSPERVNLIAAPPSGLGPQMEEQLPAYRKT